MPFTVEQARPTLVLIGKNESGCSYTIVYGGIPKAQRPADLRKMTISEVLAWQREVVNAGSASSAAGYYQIIRKTLQASYEPAGMALASLFDEAGQDKLGMYLLAGRGFQKFLDGKLSEDDMMIGLAKEWASFPVPHDMQGASRWVKEGQSYYAGDGLNKAHATTSEVRAALRQSKSLYGNPARPLLKLGDKGDDVRDLQMLLAARGLYRWAVDGDFGQRTDATVRYFQAIEGLTIDGKAWTQVWTALGV
ncbi:peptidoglycan-binding protein [Paracoccus sp. NGMCC 1.201697]|uniref:Peptidoglycan-binding protein n=1 Tax=Paracoccus broussonetiae subsp. drimophilus TaxID=3373869 RepID=A0ABW7LJQ0_9RHOB